MATNFPGDLDTLSNPLVTDHQGSPLHSDQHANANDSIEALQAKVGINNSAVPSSLDYKISTIEATRPLDFPVTIEKNHHVEQGSADPLQIFYKATGNSGLITEIQFIIEGQPANFGPMVLNIKYDGEASPSVALPLNSLIAIEDTTKMLSFVYESDMFLVNGDDGGISDNQMSVVLRWPIPYTDGIEIYVSGLSTGSWSNVTYQDSLPECWNRNLRFYANRSDQAITAPSNGAGTLSISGTSVTGSGTNFTVGDIGKYIVINHFNEFLITSVTDTTHCTVATADGTHDITNQAYQIDSGHVWLNRPSGKTGYLCQIGYGITSTGSGSMEVNPRIFINQETEPSLEWSGTEDLFEGSFYWTIPRQNRYGGIVCLSTVSGVVASAYKLFTKRPKLYTNGIKGIQANMGYTTTFNITSIYYEFTS